jgi:BirA family transcriptional regulator, biotin operon repressor / biotin---[acetyl-CoA-carboxylase] ligase
VAPITVDDFDQIRWRSGDVPDAEQLGVIAVRHAHVVSSTMDVAHHLAERGAPAGTLVVADAQQLGRGRAGHTWASANAGGVWMTLLERPQDAQALGVLSLRVGLAVADAIAPLADRRVRLKWPNDVFVGAGKVAGVLVEARWRDAHIEWVAIGIGINLVAPRDVPDAAGLRAGVTRNQVLRDVLPRLRAAAACTGLLSDGECAAWHARDCARGQRVVEPREGTVVGIAPDGALGVESADGSGLSWFRSGSLRFADGAGPSPSVQCL